MGLYLENGQADRSEILFTYVPRMRLAYHSSFVPLPFLPRHAPVRKPFFIG